MMYIKPKNIFAFANRLPSARRSCKSPRLTVVSSRFGALQRLRAAYINGGFQRTSRLQLGNVTYRRISCNSYGVSTGLGHSSFLQSQLQLDDLEWEFRMENLCN